MHATRIAQTLAALSALALSTAAALAPAAHAGPTTTRWAAPVDGWLYDPARWENGLAPSPTVGAIIDAQGSAYTVNAFYNPTSVRSILVDSADATLFALTQNSLLDVTESLEIRRGRFALQGRVSGGEVRVGPGASFDILNEPLLFTGPDGALLLINVVNDGTMNIAGEALLAQQSRYSDPIPLDRSITNSSTGVMRFAGGNFVTIATLNNFGLIEVENDPAFQGSNGLYDFDGSAFGYLRTSSEEAAAVVNNHGVIRLHQRDLHIEGRGQHSGVFELLSPDAMLQFRGEHTFEPGMSITGSGLTRLYNPLTMSGAIQTEGDLELFTNLHGEFVTDLALDVDGDLVLNLVDSPTFTNSVRAGRITGDTYGITFAGDADIVFAEPYGAAQFLGNAIIRGDHLGGESVFHASARIIGSVERSEFRADAIIDADASRVTLRAGAHIGGNLTGGAEGAGAITVGGDLIASTGAWLFSTPQNGQSPTRLEVAGNVEITTDFTLQGSITVGGAFSAIGGRFESVTADTIDFDASSLPAGAIVRLRDGATLTSHNGPARISNTLIRTDPTGGALGAEEVIFASGFELITPSNGSPDNAGLAVILNAFTGDATTFVFLADSAIAGNLNAVLLGDASLLDLGQSFTILEGRAHVEFQDEFPSLTGRFDRLFLPSLSNDLFFTVVYEPSAVRLVVVPTPGAISAFALAGLAAARRRR